MLLLHGGPGAHHDYLLPQCLALTDIAEVVTYDQRGGGRSKNDASDPVTAATHVADLALVADELVPGPLTIVGYSWGALLALLYTIEATRDAAVRLPARLILIAPAPVTRALRREFEVALAARSASPWVAAERAALAASGLRESDPDANRQRGFELSVAGYFADPARARDLTPFRVTGRVQQSVWESLGDFDLTDALGAVRVPAIVIHGREDPIPLESSRRIATQLGADLRVLDDCGHVPYVEAPGPLFGTVRSFLESTAFGER